ncbi:Thiamine-binding protein [Pedococcus dokdonensis]|uniref:Thiamine-binding protein n=1 Tax=Pedococcus dokdonensis TaxID=443156 RepID=A0A1H0UKB3_9MICO|nr:helix-turn-helix domain-containing protein [Pedococcus dokdonensis]SDP66742.1 Thiamine-binding protein [Pedococcus dokdonensis]
MRVRVEFTTEPFHGEDDHLPAHVTASAEALRQAGLSPDLGPLGTSVEGDADVVVDAVSVALKEALSHGATRVTLTLDDADAVVTSPAPSGTEAGAGSAAGAADAAGAATDLTDGLSRLITDVERELGGPLATLPRAEKQHAVRLLEERGAFEMRRSAETVAEALGLTRFTVYNYLNRIRDAAAEPTA